MSQLFKDKVVLVTGGSSGIGLAVARRFARDGGTVFITGRRREHLDRAAEELGSGVTPIQGDVANLSDLDRLYEQIGRTAGRVDVVVANAGWGEFLEFGKYTESHVDATFGINVKGTIFTVQKALPLMPHGSAVVLLGSIAGNLGLPAFGVYSATKAAIRSLARTWAVDLKDRHIRVNVVSPGYIPTPAYEYLGISAEALNGVLPRIPAGRLGTPEDVAGAVAFLASRDSEYLNGTELIVDGGFSQV